MGAGLFNGLFNQIVICPDGRQPTKAPHDVLGFAAPVKHVRSCSGAISQVGQAVPAYDLERAQIVARCIAIPMGAGDREADPSPHVNVVSPQPYGRYMSLSVFGRGPDSSSPVVA